MNPPTEAEVAAALDPQKCQLAVARLAGTFGSFSEWDSELLMAVDETINGVLKGTVFPKISDQSSDVLSFWREVSGLDGDG